MAQGKYADVNGLHLYYETHGAGKPLLLLHGGLGGIGMFGETLPLLAKDRQVIAAELQAHAHTPDIDRPMSFEGLADDVAALIRHLGLAQADLCGYSLGGGVALQTAVRHPRLVRRLAVVSAPHKSGGWYPEMHAAMKTINADSAKAWVGSPMHQAYVAVAPDPEGWTALVSKAGRMVGADYDWSQALAALTIPVLIALGDADAVRTAAAVEFFELFGGGKADGGFDGSGMSRARLAILPGTTHYNITATPLLASVIASFLDAPMPNPS